MLEQRAIGDILLRRGVVTSDVLEGLYAQQREKDAPLLDIVVQTRAASEVDVARALAAECGLAYVEKIDVNAVALAAAMRLPIGYARAHKVLVIAEHEHQVDVVCGDPLDTAALDDIRAAFGKSVRVVVGSGEMVVDAIHRVFEKQDTAGDLKSDDQNLG